MDSPNGLIEINHQDVTHKCCNENLNMADWNNASVEIKAPYPDPFKVTVHYKLPRYYVMQVLMHMKDTKTEQNIYTSVGSNSVIFIECRYPQGLSMDIWDRLCFYYGKIHPTQPKKVKDLPQEFNELLDNYIEIDTFLICELPIIHGKEGHISTLTNSIPTIYMLETT